MKRLITSDGLESLGYTRALNEPEYPVWEIYGVTK